MMPINDRDDLSNVAQNAPIGICILDADSLIVQIVNTKFLDVAGKTYEAVIRKYYWEPFAELREYYEEILNAVIQTGQAYYANEVEITLIRHGKSEVVFVTFVYSPIKNEQGKVTKIAIWVLENTQQVIARQKIEAANAELEKAQLELNKTFLQLEESEIALRLAIDAANFGTWYIHSVTRAFITDARLRELFGYYADEEITIEQALAQITSEYRGYVATALENAIYKGGDYDVTYPVVGLHDEKLRWLRAIGNLKADPSGDFSAFTGVVMEVTEQKLDEQRKNDFIGMVSHELKTPLTSLNAIVQVAETKLKNSEDSFLSEAMHKAHTQVKRMSVLINGFLNVSRLESSKMPIEKQTFNIEELIKDVIDETKLTVSSHEINFKPCNPVNIHADHDKISSVIFNLIGNAIKYSPKGKRISITCTSTIDKVEVSVQDEGMGIKPKEVDKIFDRYYRIKSNHTQHISGFGIGLYLSSEIIKRHQGNIWVESESGKGSTFYFSLPL